MPCTTFDPKGEDYENFREITEDNDEKGAISFHTRIDGSASAELHLRAGTEAYNRQTSDRLHGKNQRRDYVGEPSGPKESEEAKGDSKACARRLGDARAERCRSNGD